LLRSEPLNFEVLALWRPGNDVEFFEVQRLPLKLKSAKTPIKTGKNGISSIIIII
jgi:hypothetical protein